MMYCVKKFSLACAALGLTMLLACGNESTTEVTGQAGIAMQEAGTTMPGCDSESAGNMVYVADSAAVYYCADGKWQTLNGKNGERGDVGEKGEKGDTGVDGKTPEVKDGADCTIGEPSTDTDGNTVIAVACGENIKTLTLAKGSKGDNGGNCTVGEPSTDTEGNTVVAVTCGETSEILTMAKGVKGNTGAGCSAGEPSTDEDGNTVVEVTCDETTRTLTIAKGGKGDLGESGIGCTVEAQRDGKVEVTCGETTRTLTIAKGEQGEQGTGCTAEDLENGNIVVTCGEDASKTEQTLYRIVAQCGGENFDPKKTFCLEDKIYDLCNAVAYNPEKEYCLTLEGENGVKKETVEELLFDDREKDNVRVYKTVEICDEKKENCQTWMAENLNYAPTVSGMGNHAWSGCYDGWAENCTKYGRLYTWEVAMNNADCLNYTCNASLKPVTPVRGVCPQGWHLPSHYEFEELINHIDPNFGYNHTDGASSSTAGKYLKAKSGWDNSGSGTDDYGFSALPGGGRHSYILPTFYQIGSGTSFWSSGESDEYRAFFLRLAYVSDAHLGKDDRSIARSVRCIKD